MQITNKNQLMFLKELKRIAADVVDGFINNYYIIVYNAYYSINKGVFTSKGFRNPQTIFQIQGQVDKNVIGANPNVLWDKLYKGFYLILLSKSALMVQKDGKPVPSQIINPNLYQLLTLSKQDRKQREIIEWAMKKLVNVVNTLTMQENQTLANGMSNYNPNTGFSRLYRNIKKTYKTEIANKYETYKNILNIKSV